MSSLGSLANRVAAAVWNLGVLCWLLLTQALYGDPTPFLHTTSECYILTAVRMTTEISAFIRDNVPFGKRKFHLEREREGSIPGHQQPP